ncbi:MAG: hypothetical protein HPY90_10465 [Syntrophothermus sp.]|uniref:hypothetical protein n=1 Tax=Syntrophothermus sp. TaxID=2736299 RepID=UPI00257D7FC3|nr:hypothetical protein [Syntrophothermus sp.]NSW83672.1 hypothetical protein [Syntrophothermus sp.]
MISMGTELGLRKPKKTLKDSTMGLYYTGKSFSSVIQWLYTGAELYNPAARENFEEIMSKAKAMRLYYRP